MTCNRLLHIAGLLLHRLHFAIITAAERTLWRLSGVTLGEGVRVEAGTKIMDADFHTDDPRTTNTASFVRVVYAIFVLYYIYIFYKCQTQSEYYMRWSHFQTILSSLKWL